METVALAERGEPMMAARLWGWLLRTAALRDRTMEERAAIRNAVDEIAAVGRSRGGIITADGLKKLADHLAKDESEGVLTQESLLLCADVSYQLARMLKIRCPEAHWMSARGGKTNLHYHMPVLCLREKDRMGAPLYVQVSVYLEKALRGDPDCRRGGLRRLFDLMVKIAEGYKEPRG